MGLCRKFTLAAIMISKIRIPFVSWRAVADVAWSVAWVHALAVAAGACVRVNTFLRFPAAVHIPDSPIKHQWRPSTATIGVVERRRRKIVGGEGEVGRGVQQHRVAAWCDVVDLRRVHAFIERHRVRLEIHWDACLAAAYPGACAVGQGFQVTIPAGGHTPARVRVVVIDVCQCSTPDDRELVSDVGEPVGLGQVDLPLAVVHLFSCAVVAGRG